MEDVDDVLFIRNYIRKLGWDIADNGDIIIPRAKLLLSEEINKKFVNWYKGTWSKFEWSFSIVTRILIINSIILLVLGLVPHFYAIADYVAKSILDAVDPSGFTEQMQTQESSHHVWWSKFKKWIRKANIHWPRYSWSKNGDYSLYFGEADSFNQVYLADDMETATLLSADPEYSGHLLRHLVAIEEKKNWSRKNNFWWVNWWLRQCDLAEYDEFLDWVEDTKPKIAPEKKDKFVEAVREHWDYIRQQKPARVEWKKIRNEYWKKKWGSRTGKLYLVKQYWIGYEEGKITLLEPRMPKNKFPTAESPEALLKLKKKIKKAINMDIIEEEDYLLWDGQRLAFDHLLMQRNPSYWGRFITPKVPTRLPFHLAYYDHKGRLCNDHFKRIFPLDASDRFTVGLLNQERDIVDPDLEYFNRNGFAKKMQPITWHVQYMPKYTLAFCLVMGIVAVLGLYILGVKSLEKILLEGQSVGIWRILSCGLTWILGCIIETWKITHDGNVCDFQGCGTYENQFVRLLN